MSTKDEEMKSMEQRKKDVASRSRCVNADVCQAGERGERMAKRDIKLLRRR